MPITNGENLVTIAMFLSFTALIQLFKALDATSSCRSKALELGWSLGNGRGENMNLEEKVENTRDLSGWKICPHTHTYIQTHKYTHAHTLTRTSTHTQTHTITQSNIHMHTHTHTHTHTRTRTHTQTQKRMKRKKPCNTFDVMRFLQPKELQAQSSVVRKGLGKNVNQAQKEKMPNQI